MRCFTCLLNGWKTPKEGVECVRASLLPDRVSRVALDESGDDVRWIGVFPMSEGHLLMVHQGLHPMAKRVGADGASAGRG